MPQKRLKRLIERKNPIKTDNVPEVQVVQSNIVKVGTEFERDGLLCTVTSIGGARTTVTNSITNEVISMDTTDVETLIYNYLQ